MSDVCACCGGTGIARPLTVADLRDWCRSNGVTVLAGDYIDTRGAASLLGLQPQTLRASRGRIPFERRGRRCLYRLVDLLDVDFR